MRKLLALLGFKSFDKINIDRPKCMYGGPEMFFREIDQNPKEQDNNNSNQNNQKDNNNPNNNEKDN